MDGYGSKEDNILPMIGRYRCFIGSAHSTEPMSPFYKTSKFLYFYLIISVIVVGNVILFLITGASLLSHWWQMKGLSQGYEVSQLAVNEYLFYNVRSVSELFKTQLSVIAKLFIIMGKFFFSFSSHCVYFSLKLLSGIPWSCDIISVAVSHAYTVEESFEIRMVLDILNLLTVS